MIFLKDHGAEGGGRPAALLTSQVEQRAEPPSWTRSCFRDAQSRRLSRRHCPEGCDDGDAVIVAASSSGGMMGNRRCCSGGWMDGSWPGEMIFSFLLRCFCRIGSFFSNFEAFVLSAVGGGAWAPLGEAALRLRVNPNLTWRRPCFFSAPTISPQRHTFALMGSKFSAAKVSRRSFGLRADQQLHRSSVPTSGPSGGAFKPCSRSTISGVWDAATRGGRGHCSARY